MSGKLSGELPEERDPTTIFGDAAHWRGDVRMISALLRQGHFDIPGAALERLGAVMQSMAVVSDVKKLSNKDKSIVINAARVILKIADHNLDRLRLQAAIALKALGIDDESASKETKIVVVEDESWYGNNAHIKTTEAAPVSSADPHRPGPV